ncbi:hypothetical protein F751_5946 [Auxenochlorella protothecoides]|uniref:Uncharacterized protein n=1 Tax=Auxenochlorella protothecoides TaxID=3075 RepID=A0A087SQA4_AUXPR|nr:hypothetical protein F751_5946 [Auxenochlorella protothecoides]KFM27908.1 hypothetical protein F751_5946 [Auxenochlorella protothecoides]
MAEREGSKEVVQELHKAMRIAMDAKQASLRPELQLMNLLMAAPDGPARAKIWAQFTEGDKAPLDGAFFTRVLARFSKDVASGASGTQKDKNLQDRLRRILSPARSLEEGVTRVFERQQNIGVELADIRRQIAAFNATTSKLATAANKVVKGQVRHHAVPKLVADLAAVLCGLRPSLMLDYALLTPKIALELARQASLLGDCPLTVAQLADCTFFLRPDRYLPDAAPPLFIDFTSGTATWVEPGSERGTSLAGVAAEVRASVARRAVASGAPCLLTLDCDRWAARGAALPTLAGILLGYPAVYAIGSQEEGAQAARCLSSGGLVLHSLTAGLQAGRDPSPPAILAYSVPASLLPDTEMDERAMAWEAEARVAAAVVQGGGWAWGDVGRSRAAAGPRPVVL